MHGPWKYLIQPISFSEKKQKTVDKSIILDKLYFLWLIFFLLTKHANNKSLHIIQKAKQIAKTIENNRQYDVT